MKRTLLLLMSLLTVVGYYPLRAGQDNNAAPNVHGIDKKLVYGASLPTVVELFANLGIKVNVNYTCGLPPEVPDGADTKEARSEASNFEYCIIDLIEKHGLCFGFSTDRRLISFSRIHNAAINRTSFGLSIAAVFSKLAQTRESGGANEQTAASEAEPRGDVSKPPTKAVFINNVERNVKFGDDVGKIIQILTRAGVDARCEPLSLMTDEELVKASGQFTDDEKIGAEYYVINIANDIGMRFSFNCQKQLIRYERRWRFSAGMNGKTIADIETTKGSETL
jgi:hypothetical protein